MEIRRAVTVDFLEIAGLDREAWEGGIHSEFIPDGEHAWRIWTEHAIVFCAKQSEIFGAILAFPTINGDYCIHKVFVKKEHRRKGIGSSLFKSLLEETDRLNVSVFLTVDPDNYSAINLYKKWGFEKQSLIKSYYRQEEDRYILSRKANKL